MGLLVLIFVLLVLWCSVLQCVAVCCSALQCVAVRCSVLQCIAVLYYFRTSCLVVQCVAVCCSVLQCLVALNSFCKDSLLSLGFFHKNRSLL